MNDIIAHLIYLSPTEGNALQGKLLFSTLPATLSQGIVVITPPPERLRYTMVFEGRVACSIPPSPYLFLCFDLLLLS